MRRFILALTIVGLLPLAGVVAAEETRDPYQYFFSQTLGDYREELANAKAQGKKGVFVFFEMDECPFCHYMKNTVLNRVDVQDYIHDRFLAFNIDIEGDVMITTFDGQEMSQKDYAFKVNKVRATPVLAFFDLQGERVFRFTGKTQGVEEFLQMADFVADGHYKTTSFNNYKRSAK